MADNGSSPSNTTVQIVIAIISVVGVLGAAVVANWEKIFPRSAVVNGVDASPPLATQPATPLLETVRIEGKNTFRGYGFFTPRGYVITDKIPLEREPQISAELTTGSANKLITLQLVNISESLPLALTRVLRPNPKIYVLPTRNAGSLKIGEEVELYRGPNFTTKGTVTRKSVEASIEGAHGTESHQDLLETTSMASPGDSGAPVIDRAGRIVGILYAGSRDKSLIIPIERIMSAFPVAF